VRCPMCGEDDFGRVKGHKTKVFCRSCGWQHINGDMAIKPRPGRPKEIKEEKNENHSNG